MVFVAKLKKFDKTIENLSNERLVAELIKIEPPSKVTPFKEYVHKHIHRFKCVLSSLQPPNDNMSLLDVGGIGNLLPVYINLLGYRFIAIANKWPCETLDPMYLSRHIPLEQFRCDNFDAELDSFPYQDESFDSVVCSEVLEHLKYDPVHMLAEINRVLKPNGALVLTTPNITSQEALYRMLAGKHPQIWSIFTGKDSDRHNREYTPLEINKLLRATGFGNIKINTFSLSAAPLKVKLITFVILLPWVLRGNFNIFRNRGAFILAVCSKKSVVQDRYPGWLYGES